MAKLQERALSDKLFERRFGHPISGDFAMHAACPLYP